MKRKGFTLIELLIVVAIIGILAAIAIPNFLNAQTRAKVAKVTAELQMCATTMEMYFVDNNCYPCSWINSYLLPSWGYSGADTRLLTTPVKYASSIPWDIFNMTDDDPFKPLTVGILNTGAGGQQNANSWMAYSWGPDLEKQTGGWRSKHAVTLGRGWSLGLLYDPTNGTTSAGDIYRFGPGSLVAPKWWNDAVGIQ